MSVDQLIKDFKENGFVTNNNGNCQYYFITAPKHKAYYMLLHRDGVIRKGIFTDRSPLFSTRESAEQFFNEWRDRDGNSKSR